VGFVYVITNRLTNQKYIGKKLAQFTKTSYRMETLKNGTKRRKKSITKTESDWETYWGSSDSLQKDIEKYGLANFRREILYYCQSKSECNYLEAREQMDRRVLERTDYYNNNIQVRVHGNHIQNKIQK
jgi:hypothetical protein